MLNAVEARNRALEKGWETRIFLENVVRGNS